MMHQVRGQFLGLLFLCLLVCHTSGPAQTQAPRFEHISVDDGLSQSTGQAILQDRQGFLWFATQDGLNKYDGIQFTIFRHDAEDTTSIAGNVINSMCLDNSGAMWLAFEGGSIDRFDPGQGKARHYSRQMRQQGEWSDKMVGMAYADSAGGLWLGTSQGLAHYLRSTDTFEYFELDSLASEEDVVTAIVAGKAETLWLGTLKGGLFTFDRAAAEFQVVRRPEQFSHSRSVGAISQIRLDRFGDLWFATSRAGIWRLNPDKGSWVTYEMAAAQSEGGRPIPVSCLVEDASSDFWVGTEGYGLFHLRRDTGEFSAFRYDPYEPFSLNNNVIKSLFLDAARTLWVGTSGGGINKYDPKKIKFQHIRHTLKNPDLLRGNMIWSIFEDSKRRLWLGTHTGGLNVLDQRSGDTRVFEYSEQTGGVGPGTAFSVCEDLDGTIWVGTRGGGLSRFNEGSGTFKRYLANRRNPEGLLGRTVRAMHVDSEGIIWMAVPGGGLHRFEPRTERFTHYLHNEDDGASIASNSAITLFEDSRNDIWVGTSNAGVCRFDRATGSFERFHYQDDARGSLSNDFVMAIAEDTSGAIWVGTYSGINRFDSDTRTFSRYNVKDGLPNGVVYGALADDRGGIWLSTNRGLSRLDVVRGTFRNYHLDDGLQSYEYNSGAFFKNRDGQMFFGGINGVNMFHPDSIRDNPYAPPVVVSGVKKFDQDVELPGVPFEPVRFSYTDNFVTFEFAALDFTNPERNEFAYKLDGLNEDWIYCGNQRYATFTNLGAGHYEFHVKAANNDGVWNETGASLRIVVTPPFWQSWWFRLLSVVAGLTATFLTVRHLQRKQKHKAERERRFSELKLKALRAQMNPHFVFNTLNSIQYFISSNERKSAFEYLSKFSKLMRCILDNSERATVTVAEELDALRLYLDLERLRFEGKFDYHLTLDPAIDQHTIEIPTLLIQPLVENAILHGLNCERTGGLLDITLSLGQDAIVCSIEDNGIGIEKSLEQKPQQNGQHKSAGLKVTQERLQTLNALRRNGKSIEIIDLGHENGQSHESHGTRVKIVIPIENN